MLSGNNDPNGAGDPHEGFEFGYEHMEVGENTADVSSDGVMTGANVWPSQKLGFREAALTY